MKFIIALFFMACQSEVTEINMKTNSTWKKTQPESLNYVYMITESNQQYLSVLITLSGLNSNFMLVSQNGSAVIDLNQKFTEGTTIDTISAQENRLTRNLNIDINETILPIYISTFDYLVKSRYHIIIKSSDKMGCPNDCSGKGECLYYGCKCSKNYVGNDCHQIAHEINGTVENQLLLNKVNATYFYLQFDEYQGKNGEIKFSTLDESQIKIYLLKSLSLAYPSYSVSQFDENLFEQNIVTNQNSQIIQFQDIEQIGITNRVVFVALVQNNNATLNVQISLNSNDGNSLEVYQIVLIVFSPILVGLVVLVYKKYKKNQLYPNPADQDQPIQDQSQNIEIQSHQQSQNLNQSRSQDQIQDQESQNLNENSNQNNNQNPNQNNNQNPNQNNNKNLADISIDNSNYNQNTNFYQNQNSNIDIIDNPNDNDQTYLNLDQNLSDVENDNLYGNNKNKKNYQNSNGSHDNSLGNQSDDDICFICKQNLVDDLESSKAICKICKHIFHKDCLIPWVQDHNSCPKCQADLSLQILQAYICQNEVLIRPD